MIIDVQAEGGGEGEGGGGRRRRLQPPIAKEVA